MYVILTFRIQRSSGNSISNSVWNQTGKLHPWPYNLPALFTELLKSSVCLNLWRYSVQPTMLKYQWTLIGIYTFKIRDLCAIINIFRREDSVLNWSNWTDSNFQACEVLTLFTSDNKCPPSCCDTDFCNTKCGTPLTTLSKYKTSINFQFNFNLWRLKT